MTYISPRELGRLRNYNIIKFQSAFLTNTMNLRKGLLIMVRRFLALDFAPFVGKW